MRFALRIGFRKIVLEFKLDQLPVVNNLSIRGLAVVEQLQAIFRVDGLRAAGREHLERADGEQHQHNHPQPRGLPPRTIAVAAFRRVIGITAAEWVTVVPTHWRPLLRALRIAHACSP